MGPHKGSCIHVAEMEESLRQHGHAKSGWPEESTSQALSLQSCSSSLQFRVQRPGTEVQEAERRFVETVDHTL